MGKPLKTPPPCPVASVDHALRAATMLQVEGGATVSQIAERLGVARSTAHRILAVLVYRDFAVRGEDRVYRAGPVRELAAHSQSLVSRLRAAALPHLHRLADLLDETANLIVQLPWRQHRVSRPRGGAPQRRVGGSLHAYRHAA